MKSSVRRRMCARGIASCVPPLVALLSLAATASASAQTTGSAQTAATAQPTAPAPWWKAEGPTKELGLTSDQSSRIDTIFHESIAQLQQEKDQLDQLESRLSRLIEQGADETRVVGQIDRVEAVRASLNKTRTLMLLHMRQVLTPDQRLKMSALQERWQQEQREKAQRDKPGQRSDGNNRPDDAHKRPN
jgi:Spy/CpxP family protein refolding chaperone